jgi:spermidine/putrescine transport system permease protein
MLLADAGQTTLPVYIYGMLRLGVSPEVNAVSTLLLLSSLVIVLAALRLQNLSNKKP